MSDEEARNVIATNLKRLRNGRSYSDLGRAAQTSAGAIRDIELSGRMPGVGLLTRLADALEVGVEELLRKSPKSH